MKAQPTPTIDDTLLAVAELAADSWRVLLVRRGDKPSVLEARTFASADESGLGGWLQSQRCGDLRVVLPAAATIVRSVKMPMAAPSQMLAALRLQAEGMFLGAVPLVRIGLGVMESDGDSDRQGIIMAWPESQPGVQLGAKLEEITRYVPEPAAMLVLASAGHPAISGDRSVGSIAIAMKSSKGLEIRATREAAADDIAGDGAWSEGLRSALIETALNAGVDPSRVAEFVADMERSAERSGDRILMLDPEANAILAERLDVRVSSAEDASWWRSWSIPLAAAVVVCGPLSELARLRRIEEREAPSRIVRFIERYSNPSRAVLVAGLAFGIVGIAPIASAWLRVQVLQSKMPSKASVFAESQRDIEHRIALYTALSERTVPVAKILGDLAVCTPDGIEIEQIQVSPTQGITVRGVAKGQGERSAAEAVNTMARLLDSSGVFDKTHWRWNTPDGRGIYKFDLDAQIARPTHIQAVAAERDWATKTLAERKYAAGSTEDGTATATEPAATASRPDGELASATPKDPLRTGARTPEKPADKPSNPPADATDAANAANAATGADGAAIAATTTVPQRGIGRRDPATAPPAPATADGTPATASTGAGAGGGPAATALANTAIPDPFTDEQLAGMSKEQARALLSDISRARRRQDVDAEVRKRLTDDFQRILEHLKK